MGVLEKNSRSNTGVNGDNDSADDSETMQDDTVMLEMELMGTEDVTAEVDYVFDVPKDKGWSWFVMLGTLVMATLVLGILKSGGILFVAFQERFNSTSSMTSLLSTVQNAVYSLTAPFALGIGKQVTTSRKLIFIGSLLVCTAYIITSQARDIRILFFSHGFLQGFGTAFMVPIGIVTLASYFDKKRGFANSIAFSGGSLGGLIFAPMLTAMLDHYGYPGCFLIIGGLFLNGCVTGALYRPYSFYKKNVRKTVDGATNPVEKESFISDKANTTNNVHEKYQDRAHEIENITHVNEIESVSRDHENTVLLNGTNKNTVTTDIKQTHQNGASKQTVSKSSFTRYPPALERSVHSMNSSIENMGGSMLDVRTEFQNPKKPDDGLNDKSKSGMSLKSLFKLVLSSFDITLFRNPLFCTLELASFLICANSSLLSIYIAPHARDNDIEVGKIAIMVTVVSSTDFVSRLIVAMISDRGLIRRSNITAIALFVIGISANFIRYYNSFEVLMFYSVLLGLFSGVYFSLYSVLIVDYLTIHKLQAALGFTSLFHAAGMSLFFYVIGHLRDVTGSYIVPFYVMGCACLVGSALHFSLPFVERCYKRKQQE